MRRSWFTSGEWNVICDRCGTKNKSTDLKQDWQGLMLCGKCWEPRHPQDLIRPIPEQQKLPWTRPEAADIYIPITYAIDTFTCSPEGILCQADYGTADCMTVGVIDGARIP